MFVPLSAQSGAQAEPDGFITLVEAARMGDLTLVERSLAEGTDINQLGGTVEYGFRYPVLFHALHARQWAVAKLLIDRGADVVAPVEGRVPFSWAANFGSGEVALQIWSKLTSAERHRILDNNDSWVGALVSGHLDTVDQLRKLGFSLPGKDDGATALHAAVASGRVEVLEYVLALNISPNGRQGGVTALARAAGQGNTEMMERLLARGADVDATCTTLPDVTHWFNGETTALITAVIKNEPEAAGLLLKHGANPALLKNGAIRWADLMGDAECFRLLRNAGAPEPVAFSFRDWLPDSGGDAPKSVIDGTPAIDIDLTTMLASVPTFAGDLPTQLVRPTKLAIVPLSDGLGGAEGLLAARLSAVAGVTLLERADIRRILAERRLVFGLGGSPSENSQLGALLGADAMVFLQLNPQGKQELLETRVVGVATGLVTSVQLSVWNPKVLESWVDATVRQCAADVPRIFTSPQEAKLVAVLPLSASTGGAEARETENRLTRLLCSRLACLPGVFLLERRELDRLRREDGAADQALLNSSWLISGSVEVMRAQAGRVAVNSLSLKLESGGHDAEMVKTVRTTGPADNPRALIEAAAKDIAEVFTVRTDITWEPMREAGFYFEKSRAFGESGMWTQALAAAEAASALGLQTDEVLRQRVYAAAKRALFSADSLDGKREGPIWVKDLTGKERGVDKRLTLEDVIVDRAPLVAADFGRGRGVSMEGYLELSDGMLDLLDLKLSKKAGEWSQSEFEAWMMSPVWDAATVPLRLGEALSYQHVHHSEFEALRRRLFELNDAALTVAKAKEFRTAYHTLAGLRCRLLPWWQPEEALFETEVLRVLHDAREARPAVSGHPIWGSVFMSGRAQMDVIGGRASQAWVRLARRLVKSADAEERLLGLAWLSRELPPAPAEALSDRLKEEFTAVLEADHAWTGSIWRMAYDVTKESGKAFPAVPAAPWYGDALRASKYSQLKISFSEGRWVPGPLTGSRSYPEEVAFDLASYERKAALMRDHGGSCLLWHYAVSQHFSDEEIQRILNAIKQAAPWIDAVVREHPEARNYYMETEKSIARFTHELTDRDSVRRLAFTPALKFGAPQWLFPEAVDGEDTRNLTGRAIVIDYSGYRSDGEIWWRSSGGVGRDIIFRFAPDGRVVDRVEHPSKQGGGYFFLGEARLRSENGGGDITDRYIAVQARVISSQRLPRMVDCVRLYDRRSGEWITLLPPFPVNMICDVRILEGSVFFSFLYNSEIEKTEVMGFGDFAHRGEPTWGIAEYGIKEKSYRMLVSSRRDPAESPLDSGGREYKDLIRVPPTTLVVGGMTGWIYDVAQRSWRKRTPNDQAGITKASAQPLEIEAGGDVWVVSSTTGAKITFGRKNPSSRKTPYWIKIPVELDMSSAGHGMDPALAQRVSNVTRFNYHATSHGIALSGGNFYAWVPTEQVKVALEDAVRRLSE